MTRNEIIVVGCVLLASCGSQRPCEEAINAIGPMPLPVIYYQAYDEGWYSDPSINPVFEEEWEAKDYVSRNMMNGIQSGHDYVVRVINHRYEVRQVNDEDDDILYTSNDFNSAYEYVVEYSSAHSDLIIYDLKTGKGFEETP